MAKKMTRSRRRPARQGTNWAVIGATIAVGLIALFALLMLSLREPEAPLAVDLAAYCQENPANCVSRGAEDAPVTIIEVSDYGCSHCRDFNLDKAGILDEQYVQPGQVRWVFLPYALGPQTQPAAEAAMCAAEQGQFDAFHMEMFEIQGSSAAMTKNGFIAAADKLGLDVEQFTSCFDRNKFDDVLRDNMNAARQAGVTGTPTFFINGTKVEGNQALSVFQQQIRAQVDS